MTRHQNFVQLALGCLLLFLTVLAHAKPPAPQLPARSETGEFDVIWGDNQSRLLQLEYRKAGTDRWMSIGHPRGGSSPRTTRIKDQADGLYEYRVYQIFIGGTPPTVPSDSRTIDVGGTSDIRQLELSESFSYDLEDISHLPQIDQGEFVAITQGTANVSQGTASYRVPIELPPAVQNLKPQLSLTYNSSNRNSGSVGVGWSLSGLSSIRRCRATVAQEGTQAQKSNPRYSQGDRLCLNGQKLVLSNRNAQASDADYWDSGAEYRTELDQFVKVEAVGRSANGGHDYFKVWTKSGQIHYYGRNNANQNSQVRPPNGRSSLPIRSWLLDRVEDRYGNHYKVFYQKNSSTGEYLPSRIAFAPGVLVKFHYKDKTGDYRFRYDAGHKWSQTQLLDRITTHIDSTESVPGTAVKRYQLTYERSASTQRYRLDQVQHCGYEADGYTQRCAKPLQFDWSEGKTEFNTTGRELRYCDGGEAPRASQVLDLNSDGFSDLLNLRDGRHEVEGVMEWQFALGTAEGCYEKQEWFNKYAKENEWGSLFPFSTPKGQGLLEVRRIEAEGTRARLFDLRTIRPDFKRERFNEYSAAIVKSESTSPVIVDLNNDGLSDVLFGDCDIDNSDGYSAGEAQCQSIREHGAVNAQATAFLQNADQNGILPLIPKYGDTYIKLLSPHFGAATVDLNSDGLQDAISIFGRRGRSNDPAKTYISTNHHGQSGAYTHDAQSFKNASVNYIQNRIGDNFKWLAVNPVPVHHILFDANGDGLQDIAYDGGSMVALNTGNGYGAPLSTGSRTFPGEFFFKFDYNMDGLEDLIVSKQLGPRLSWRILQASTANGQLRFDYLDIDPFNGKNNIIVDRSWHRHGQVFRGDLNNDGVMDFYRSGLRFYPKDSEPDQVFYGKYASADVMTTVTDGFGKKVRFTYSKLAGKTPSNETFYRPALGATPYPLEPMKRSREVVKLFEVIGPHTQNRVNRKIEYRYEDGRIDRRGRGSVGFKRIIQKNRATHNIITTDYHQDFPFIGRIKRSERKDTNNNLINVTTNRYTRQADNPHFIYRDYQEVRQFGLFTTYNYVSHALSQTVTTATYDRWGNLTNHQVSIGSGWERGSWQDLERRVTTTNRYVNSSYRWLLGFMSRSTQTSARKNKSQTVITNYTQYPGTLDYETRTTFDSHAGREISVTETVKRLPNGTIYEQSGAFPALSGLPSSSTQQAGMYTTPTHAFEQSFYAQEVSNKLGHKTEQQYDKRFGVVKHTTDPNGLVTEQAFDALGRLVLTTFADGSQQRISRYYCDNLPWGMTCPTEAVYTSVTTLTHPNKEGHYGAPITATYYDALARTVRTEQYAFNGETLKTDTKYTSQGYLERVSAPYSHTPNWTIYANYDALGRAQQTTEPDGARVTMNYRRDSHPDHGYLVLVTEQTRRDTVWDSLFGGNSLAEKTHKTYTDAAGQVVRIVDALGTQVRYDYNPQGLLSETIVNNDDSTRISIGYDLAGNKTSLTDPSAGALHFQYDGNGNLRRQTWAPDTPQAKSMTFVYDDLGRTRQRIERASNNSQVTHHWVWDTKPKRKGLISERTGPGYQSIYSCDSLSRMTGREEKQGSSRMVLIMGYDTFSRLNSEIYYDQAIGGFHVKTETDYHAAGQRVRLRDITHAAAQKTLWQLGDTMDQWGHWQHEAYGNQTATRTTYNVNGQVTGRLTGKLNSASAGPFAGTIQDLHFGYDTQGHLFERYSDDLSERFTHDEMGRLTASLTSAVPGISSEITRDYDYNELGNLTYKSEIGSIRYARTQGASVHGVTRANNKNYHYDAYGNVIRRGNDTLTYNVLNKPTRIGNQRFTYGGDHELLTKNDGAATTGYYFGGNYEEVTVHTTGERLIKVKVGGFLSITKRFNASGTLINTQERYQHYDHIGSVHAITDENGNLRHKLGFDAWGNARQPNGSRLRSSPTWSSFDYTTEGYTGHEQLDELGLVHMGGRVYDPLIGRFLSADLFVQAPYNSQSYNRYTYVFNSPLSLIDPTGYQAAPPIEEVVVTGIRPSPPPGIDLGGYEPTPGEQAGPDPGILAWSIYSAELEAQQAFERDSVNQAVSAQAEQAAKQAQAGVFGIRGFTRDENGNLLFNGEGPKMGMAPNPKAIAAAAGVAAKRLVSRIKESSRLVKEAERAGKSNQKSIDKLTEQLSTGNMNPGIGTKPIGRGFSEARARDGGRVYFRERKNSVEILGKSNKANQQTVIDEILSIF